ncbi:hypothetical protein MTO96_040057 [Rhipicephalus appendiculatus]
MLPPKPPRDPPKPEPKDELLPHPPPIDHYPSPQMSLGLFVFAGVRRGPLVLHGSYFGHTPLLQSLPDCPSLPSRRGYPNHPNHPSYSILLQRDLPLVHFRNFRNLVWTCVSLNGPPNKLPKRPPKRPRLSSPPWLRSPPPKPLPPSPPPYPPSELP